MSKKEVIGWIFSIIVLVLLFLMSSTDILIKEKVAEILPVSVIIRNDSDRFYQNFKKGMEQAAKDYSVDVSFITLYENNDSRQQQQIIKRELEDGARALVLVPVNDRDVRKMIESGQITRPLVIIDSQPGADLNVSDISIDYHEAGKMAACGLAEKTPAGIPVWILTEGLDYGPNNQAYEGAMEILGEQGYECKLVSRENGDTFRQVIEGTVYPKNRPAAVLAIDGISLSEAAQILEKSTVYQQNITGLYGIGATVEALNYMDKEIIDGLVAYSQYDSGYLSIQKAVEMIKNPGIRAVEPLKMYYIEKKDLRDKRYEKMLYPIE